MLFRSVKVLKGKDIFVSVYRHATEPKLLAVISHIGKGHDTQEIELQFDLKKLNMPSALTSAVEQFTKPDPDYAWLKPEQVTDYGFDAGRAPLKLGEFGGTVESVQGDTLKLKLKYHTVALVELQ